MKQNSRIQLENTLIGALGVLSLVLFILSFLPGLGLANRVGILLEMGHMVQRAFSVVLFILTFQLWKRKRAAWNIAVLLLFLSFLRGLTALSSPLYLPFHLAEAVLFLLLLCFRKDFCCPSDRRSLGRSLLFLLLALAGIIVNAGISYHFSVKPLGETSLDSLMDSLIQGTAMIFGMGNPSNVSRETHVVELVTFWFSWGCILASILYAVRPWLLHPVSHASDLMHARTLVNLYSQNPSAYLTLEDDKLLYFGHKVDASSPTESSAAPSFSTAILSARTAIFRFSWQNLKNFASAALTTCFLSASLTIFWKNIRSRALDGSKTGRKPVSTLRTMKSLARKAPRCV